MGVLKAHKTIAGLPSRLDRDALYAVRTGEGFDLYVSDMTGSAAHRINTGPLGAIGENKFIHRAGNFGGSPAVNVNFLNDSVTYIASGGTDFIQLTIQYIPGNPVLTTQFWATATSSATFRDENWTPSTSRHVSANDHQLVRIAQYNPYTGLVRISFKAAQGTRVTIKRVKVELGPTATEYSANSSDPWIYVGNNTNANSFTETGKYHFNFGIGGDEPSGKSNLRLTVEHPGEHSTKQTLEETTAPLRKWVRTLNRLDSTWSPWESLQEEVPIRNGANILVDSDFNYAVTWGDCKTFGYDNGSRRVTKVTIGKNYGAKGVNHDYKSRRTKIVEGRQYTFSLNCQGTPEARVHGLNYVHLMRPGNAGNFNIGNIVLNDNLGKRSSVTFTAPWSADNAYILIGIQGNMPEGAWFEFHSAKLEEGVIDTGYCMSAEDIANQTPNANLLIGTKTPTNLFPICNPQGGHSTTTAGRLDYNRGEIQFRKAASNPGDFNLLPKADENLYGLEPGWYTLSATVKLIRPANTIMRMFAQVRDSSGTWIGPFYKDFPQNTVYNHLAMPFYIPTGAKGIHLGFRDSSIELNTNNFALISQVKLEKGVLPTDWRESPADSNWRVSRGPLNLDDEIVPYPKVIAKNFRGASGVPGTGDRGVVQITLPGVGQAQLISQWPLLEVPKWYRTYNNGAWSPWTAA